MVWSFSSSVRLKLQNKPEVIHLVSISSCLERHGEVGAGGGDCLLGFRAWSCRRGTKGWCGGAEGARSVVVEVVSQGWRGQIMEGFK